MTRFVTRAEDERGIILPMTLIILVVLVTMVSAMLALGTTEPQIAANLVRGAQALSLAEAGADRALAYFNADSTCVAVAQNSDYQGSTALYTFPSQCSTGTVQLYSNQTLGAGGLGTYSVRYSPVTYATILIESTGTATSGITRIVRLVVTRQWASKYGILAQTVTIPGNAQVSGNNGAIHGNGSATLSGSDYVLKTATSAGDSTTCTGCTDTARVGDSVDSGPAHPQVPIPKTVAPDMIKRATLIMGDSNNPVATLSDGTTVNATSIPSSCSPPLNAVTPAHGATGASTASVTYVPDNFILNTVAVTYGSSATTVAACTLSYAGDSGGALDGWSMSNTSGVWSLSGGSASPPNGLYYATVSLNTTNNTSPGTSATPWRVSFAAGTHAGTASDPCTVAATCGVIDMEGNGIVVPYTSGTLAFPLMIAGDIKLAGTPTLTGTIFGTDTGTANAFSGNNVQVTGNVNLTGSIVSNGVANLQGSAVITYNVSDRAHMLTNALVVLSWHAISTLD